MRGGKVATPGWTSHMLTFVFKWRSDGHYVTNRELILNQEKNALKWKLSQQKI